MPFLKHGMNGAPSGDMTAAVRNSLGSGSQRNAYDEVATIPMSPRLSRLANNLVRSAEDRAEAGYVKEYKTAEGRREARPRMFLRHGQVAGQEVDTDNSHELSSHGVSSSWIRSKIRGSSATPARAHEALQKAAKGKEKAMRASDKDDSDEAMRRLGKRSIQQAELEDKRGGR